MDFILFSILLRDAAMVPFSCPMSGGPTSLQTHRTWLRYCMWQEAAGSMSLYALNGSIQDIASFIEPHPFRFCVYCSVTKKETGRRQGGIVLFSPFKRLKAFIFSKTDLTTERRQIQSLFSLQWEKGDFLLFFSSSQYEILHERVSSLCDCLSAV